MNVVVEARQRAGLGLRELARRAGTSHATLHAYETRTKQPRIDTAAGLVAAAGFDLVLELVPRPDAGRADREAKGRELAAALRLAAQFPARHHARLDGPVFGRH